MLVSTHSYLLYDVMLVSTHSYLLYDVIKQVTVCTHQHDVIKQVTVCTHQHDSSSNTRADTPTITYTFSCLLRCITYVAYTQTAE